MDRRHILLIVAVIAVFAPAFAFEFLSWDDTGHVFLNPGIIAPSFSELINFWRQPYFGLYIPVTYSLWMATAILSSIFTGSTINPHVFHGANILVHAINTLLVFDIIRIVLRQMRPPPPLKVKRPQEIRENFWAPAIGALIFALHPVQIESVAWVSEFKGVLATGLALLCIRILLPAYRDRQSDEKAFWKKYFWALALFTASILAKPSTVILPAILVAAHQWILRRPRREALRELAPWFLAMIPLILITRFAQPPMEGEWIPPLWLRPAIALDALSFYLYKIFLPLNLSLDYTRTPRAVVDSGQVYYSWLLFVSALGSAWALRKKFPTLLLCMVVLALVTAPVSGLVPFIFQKHSTVADHYLYFAMAGFAVLVAAGFEAGPAWLRAALGAAIVACLVATSVKLSDWSTSAKLFGSIAKIYPRSYAALTEVGRDLEEQKDIAAATKYYQSALEIKPNYFPALNNMGLIFMQGGRFQEAIGHYENFIRLHPKAAIAYCNMGLALIQAGRRAEGEKFLEQAVKIEPENATVNYNLGVYKESAGFAEEAIANFTAAVHGAPNDKRNVAALVRAHQKIAETLLKSGRRPEAVAHLQAALNVEPDNVALLDSLRAVQNPP